MKKIGRYEIVEELGRGAMGVVYKASDPTIGRMVAIKLLALPPNAELGLPGAKDIFLREARAAGRLSHPGIVTVHDALEDPESHNSYIVMEFVPGQTLEKQLLAGPPFKVEKALDIARQIAEALDYAHKQQIIHRDLKPANILITEDGRAKITDFGIAKLVARENAQRTLAIMGTPSYMSPEQVTGGDLDGSSDVFSLGILLYLMLTGQKPFAGDTAAVMFKIVYQDAAPPTHIRPELNQGHDFLALRALAKDKKKRYASAREFLDDLDDVQKGLPPRSLEKVPITDLRAGDLTLVAPQPIAMAQKFAPPESKAKQRVSPLAGVVIAALGFVLAAVIWFTQTRKPPAPAPGLATASTATTTQAQAPEEDTAQGAESDSSAPDQTATSRESAKRVTTNREEAGTPLSSPSAAGTASQPVENPVAQSPSPPAAATPPPRPRVAPVPAPPPETSIQLSCQYEIAEGTLSVKANNRTLLTESLKGKKQGKLLVIRRGYSGTFSRPLKVPTRTRKLTVHVESEDGSVNLTRSTSVPAPGSKTPTLYILVKRKQMRLTWE